MKLSPFVSSRKALAAALLLLSTGASMPKAFAAKQEELEDHHLPSLRGSSVAWKQSNEASEHRGDSIIAPELKTDAVPSSSFDKGDHAAAAAAAAAAGNRNDNGNPVPPFPDSSKKKENPSDLPKLTVPQEKDDDPSHYFASPHANALSVREFEAKEDDRVDDEYPASAIQSLSSGDPTFAEPEGVDDRTAAGITAEEVSSLSDTNTVRTNEAVTAAAASGHGSLKNLHVNEATAAKDPSVLVAPEDAIPNHGPGLSTAANKSGEQFHGSDTSHPQALDGHGTHSTTPIKTKDSVLGSSKDNAAAPLPASNKQGASTDRVSFAASRDLRQVNEEAFDEV